MSERRITLTKIIIFTKQEIENLINNKMVTCRQSDGTVLQFVSEEGYDKLYPNNLNGNTYFVKVDSF